MLLKKLGEKIDAHRPRTARLVKEHGETKVCDVTIAQAIGGARGVRCLVTDISYLDPNEGIRFRGMTIPETLKALPKVPGKDMPYVEGHIWLLLTGEVPTEAEAKWLCEDLKKRRKLPDYVKAMLRAMSPDSHPMAMFSAGILAMQNSSEYVKAYNKGIGKMDHWQPTLEDALNLWAKLPVLGAFIYRLKYKGDKQIKSNPDLDMGGDFAAMMGIDAPYDDVARLYFILHSDHESGNVSAHTGHLVASALSDIYYAYSAAINGLAGPLHGLANQEVLSWIQDVMKKMNNKIPSEEEMKKFVWDTLKSGQVIPGYGHAVLRKTDPRYSEQREFCLKHLKNDPIFKFVDILYKVVPPILQEHGKAKNPWPNVDAQSGVIQWYYGLTEYDFYTVLFGIGRSLGVLSNIVWDRALGYALERPKSVTTKMLEDVAGIK
ncbi:MAG: type I citrate synthase [Deltaproteobacteria bacterium RIFOXYA12_FULL_58_15]|nr:MAG: type I citrate synthase [Deltaproteobacteria bacterium RIFOXYA12_FULL_58_15]OGR08858.1 MAG: type I citrate synthase [Deltaproteobacteria bacterium RIFOXYB12_FULL_58_9]